jgi:hypothetical protein
LDNDREEVIGNGEESKDIRQGKAAKAASKVLRDNRTSKASKKAAGSALSQRAPKRKK